MAETNHSSKIFDNFLNKRIVDFVKLSQILLYMEPVNAIYKPTLSDSLMKTLPGLLKSVENERLYSSIAHKFRKVADYWSSQIKRDLMNSGKSIPEPIILDRIKEAKITLELIHFLKVLIYLSKEDKLVKASFWKTNFLFATYLFDENIDTYINLETLFLSLSHICQTTKGNVNLNSDNAKKYKMLLFAMFNSTVNLYNVTFDKLQIIRDQLIRKSRDKGNSTLSFLKMHKVTQFFSESGNVAVVGSSGKKSDDVKNIKFFKILIYYSESFKKFVRECASDLQGSSFGDSIIQVLSILSQISSEIDAMKNKQSNLKQINEELGLGYKGPIIMHEVQPDEEALKRRAEREARDLRKLELEEQAQVARDYLKNMGNTEVIMFENEQDEDAGYVMKKNTGKTFDKKTQAYLEKIKQFQYNDEFDDSMAYDDK